MVRNFQTEGLRLQTFGLRVHTPFNAPEVPLRSKFLDMYPSHTISQPRRMACVTHTVNYLLK